MSGAASWTVSGVGPCPRERAPGRHRERGLLLREPVPLLSTSRVPRAAYRETTPAAKPGAGYDAVCSPGTPVEEALPVAGEPQPDCLFCKIAAGDVPATIVRETETTVAFRDINPQAPTHVLVIPRVHYPDAASLALASPQIAADLLREAGEVAAGEKIDSTGFRVVFNTGSGAGQTVFHAHAHVLGGRGLQWPPG